VMLDGLDADRRGEMRLARAGPADQGGITGRLVLSQDHGVRNLMCISFDGVDGPRSPAPMCQSVVVGKRHQ